MGVHVSVCVWEVQKHCQVLLLLIAGSTGEQHSAGLTIVLGCTVAVFAMHPTRTLEIILHYLFPIQSTCFTPEL